jgi:hypothetical protein
MIYQTEFSSLRGINFQNEFCSVNFICWMDLEKNEGQRDFKRIGRV